MMTGSEAQAFLPPFWPAQVPLRNLRFYRSTQSSRHRPCLIFRLSCRKPARHRQFFSASSRMRRLNKHDMPAIAAAVCSSIAASTSRLYMSLHIDMGSPSSVLPVPHSATQANAAAQISTDKNLVDTMVDANTNGFSSSTGRDIDHALRISREPSVMQRGQWVTLRKTDFESLHDHRDAWN